MSSHNIIVMAIFAVILWAQMGDDSFSSVHNTNQWTENKRAAIVFVFTVGFEMHYVQACHNHSDGLRTKKHHVGSRITSIWTGYRFQCARANKKVASPRSFGRRTFNMPISSIFCWLINLEVESIVMPDVWHRTHHHKILMNFSLCIKIVIALGHNRCSTFEQTYFTHLFPPFWTNLPQTFQNHLNDLTIAVAEQIKSSLNGFVCIFWWDFTTSTHSNNWNYHRNKKTRNVIYIQHDRPVQLSNIFCQKIYSVWNQILFADDIGPCVGFSVLRR